MDWLKRAVKPMDVLIGAVGIFLFVNMDFHNMQTVDVIYAVCFGIWFVLTAVKVGVYYRRRNETDSPQAADRKFEQSHNQRQHKGHKRR